MGKLGNIRKDIVCVSRKADGAANLRSYLTIFHCLFEGLKITIKTFGHLTLLKLAIHLGYVILYLCCVGTPLLNYQSLRSFKSVLSNCCSPGLCSATLDCKLKRKKQDKVEADRPDSVPAPSPKQSRVG